MARRIRRSRLTRYAEKQNKRQFLLFGIGTVVIIFLLIQFGGILLNLFGNIVFGIKGENEQIAGENIINEILLPPSLGNIPSATSDPEIDIAGRSSYTQGTIILYVNNRDVDRVTLRDENEFRFRNIRLREGENTIYAIYSNNNKDSNPSPTYTILRVSDNPTLEVSHPEDNAQFRRADRTITITGTTDPTSTVTVNGFRAIVGINGEFSYLFELKEGDNNIAIEATNEAGLKTTKEISVNYKE